MAQVRSFWDYFTDSLINKMRVPDMAAQGSRDTAYGANMVPGSNLMNPNPLRDSSNALIGSSSNPSMNAFQQLFGGTSEGVAGGLGDLAGKFGPGMAVQGAQMLGNRIGGPTAGAALGAAGNVGLAAAQGGANPMQDISALGSLLNLGRRLF